MQSTQSTEPAARKPRTPAATSAPLEIQEVTAHHLLRAEGDAAAVDSAVLSL